jgi:hypothetical protein
MLPAELFASYTAVEYVPPLPPHAPPPLPPAFVFVLDLALDPAEIEVGARIAAAGAPGAFIAFHAAPSRADWLRMVRTDPLQPSLKWTWGVEEW